MNNQYDSEANESLTRIIDFQKKNPTEQRRITPINKGYGMKVPVDNVVKEMFRWKTEQESINPRLNKRFAFTLTEHQNDCLHAAYNRINKPKALIIRTALYLFLTLNEYDQEKLLEWYSSDNSN